MSELWSTEENTGADAELVLAVALKVAEQGVEVVRLHRANPDVPGNPDIESAADSERK